MIQSFRLDESETLVPSHQRRYLRVRRVGDIAASSALLVVLSPVMAFTALAVVIKMGRPIFFSQVRVGQNGEFRIMKFRTMVNGAEQIGQGYMDPA